MPNITASVEGKNMVFTRF